VIEEAAQFGADLIILGWTDVPRLQRAARFVATQAPQSVLIVKGHLSAVQTMLVCSGGHEVSKRVVNLGVELAEATHAEATLLHVTGSVPAMYTGLVRMEETLEELLSRNTPTAEHLREGAAEFEEHDVAATLELRRGEVVDEILRSTTRNAYDLLLIGSADAVPTVQRLLMRDLTPRIVELTTCSVLIVRNGVQRLAAENNHSG
jgi:nucleotide-binding universal stress UspA family protein